MSQKIAIVGAGIAGLAHAYSYAKRGHKVSVYERSPRAEGASIRNFGMVWPIGQPAGEMHRLAMRSRELWIEVLDAAGLPYQPYGSLHAAYHPDEEWVIREFVAREPDRGEWIDADEALRRSPALVPMGLRGALWSPSEVVVDPRLTLWRLPEFLQERLGVKFEFSTAVRDAEALLADRVIVCSGHDFESLYPEVFATSGLTRCKLQMLRTAAQPDGWMLGPALAAGLTLCFYGSFRCCDSLAAVRARLARTMPEYERWGIHVMASQTADGAITIGDSHEYGLAVDIFNKEEIDELILRYLNGFVRLPEMRIANRWHGVYAKHMEKPYCDFRVSEKVRVVTGLGGAGMTLSFGLAEHLYED